MITTTENCETAITTFNELLPYAAIAYRLNFCKYITRENEHPKRGIFSNVAKMRVALEKNFDITEKDLILAEKLKDYVSEFSIDDSSIETLDRYRGYKEKVVRILNNTPITLNNYSVLCFLPVLFYKEKYNNEISDISPLGKEDEDVSLTINIYRTRCVLREINRIPLWEVKASTIDGNRVLFTYKDNDRKFHGKNVKIRARIHSTEDKNGNLVTKLIYVKSI
jgi:hypothetical protein